MAPRVRVVVLNYNGGELTVRCLDSLTKLDWPADSLEIVVVDNASTDGSRDRVSVAHPTVRLRASDRNRGFAGGNNLALRDLGGCDYVALLNNDTTVEPRWLGALVGALDADARAGAACSRILFQPTFLDLSLATSPSLPGGGDRRAVGVRVSGIEVDGTECWRDAQFVEGWWGLEHGDGPEKTFQSSRPDAQMRLPAGRSGRLRLSADRVKEVEIVSGNQAATFTVGREPTWHVVPLAGRPFDVVNNAGNRLVAGGYGADRGYLEADRGQYDEPAEVFAWCGASVLLRRSYLEEVGLFDERLFLYYEDLDLAWRGRALGWRYAYAPDSVVRHVHSATTVEGSSQASYYVERNRLLVLAKNAPARMAASAAVRYLLITASYGRRDVLSPLISGRRPQPTSVARRSKAFAGYLRLLPAIMSDRRQLRARQRVSDADIVGWAEPA